MFLDIFARLEDGDAPAEFTLRRYEGGLYELRLGNGQVFPAARLTGITTGQLAGLRAEIDRALAEAEAAAVAAGGIAVQ